MTLADAGRGVTPIFTNTERDPYHGYECDMQWVRVKTPPKTIKTLKQPLPVDKTYNVDEDLNNSVNEYIKNNTEYYNRFRQVLNRNDSNHLKAIELFSNKGKIGKNDAFFVFDKGTLTKQDLAKIYKMIGSKYIFGVLNDESSWVPKSPTKQEALNNIQLKIN